MIAFSSPYASVSFPYTLSRTITSRSSRTNSHYSPPASAVPFAVTAAAAAAAAAAAVIRESRKAQGRRTVDELIGRREK